MPPIWVHFGFALAASAGLGRWARGRPAEVRERCGWLGLGLVAGAVMPDADLVASSLATAAAGFDTGVGEAVHRSLTHSIALVLLLAGAGLASWRAPRLSPLLLGAAAGVGALHILPDLFYLVPVKLWAPFTLHPVGPYGPLVRDRFTDAQNNAINGVDFLGESLAYLAVWWLARRAGTANRFTGALPWIALANALVFLPLLVLVAPRVDYDAFLIWSYAPGLAFIVVTTLLLPTLARTTFQSLGAGGPHPAPAVAAHVA